MKNMKIQIAFGRIRIIPVSVLSLVLPVLGFLLLFANTPLTAQAQGSGKPAEMKEEKKLEPKPTRIKLGDDEVDFSGPKEFDAYLLPEKKIKETGSDGEEYTYKIGKRVFVSRDNKYAVKVVTKETAETEDPQSESEHVSDKLVFYDIKGNKIFEKDFGLLNGVPQPITTSQVLDNGKYVLIEIHNGMGEDYDQLEIYNTQAEVVLSTPLGNQITYYSEYYVPPSEKYVLYSKIKPTGDVELYKYDFIELRKVSEGKGLHLTFFTENDRGYVTSGAIETDEKTPSGDNYKKVIFRYFRDDRELWKAESKYEERMGLFLSKTGKYLISINAIERKLQGNRILSYKEMYYIYETASGKLAAEGKLSPEIVEKYKNETINDRGTP